MIFQRNVFLVATSLLIVACGGGGGDAGGGTGGGGSGGGVTVIDPATVTFTDDYVAAGKTQIPYPSTWGLEILPDPELLMVYAEPVQSNTDTFRENAALVRVTGNSIRALSGLTSINQISSRSASIDGFNGTETIFDAVVPGESIQLRFMEISFTYRGETLGLLYSGERASFDRNRDIIRYMVAEMRVGQILVDGMSSGSGLDNPGLSPLANDGNNFLAVTCQESRDFPYPSDLVGQIIGPDRELVGSAIMIHANVDTGNTHCRYTRPNITFDGTNYMVAYMASVNDRRHIVVKRITTGGQLLDANPIDVSGGTSSAMFEPTSIYTGSQHLVVWNEDTSNNLNDNILGAFVNPDGSTTTPFLITDQVRALYPDQFGFLLMRTELAMAQDRIIVTMEPRFERDTRPPTRPIYAQIMDLNGVLQLANPLLVREDNGDSPRYTTVTSDGQSFFVTWVEGLLEEGTISAGTFGIYGRQIATDGQLVNGDASTTGLQIEAPRMDIDIEDLRTYFIDNEYRLIWSSTSYASNYGIYENRVSADLSTITPFRPVAGTPDLTYNTRMPRGSFPALSKTATQEMMVWPSDSGTLDGWVP